MKIFITKIVSNGFLKGVQLADNEGAEIVGDYYIVGTEDTSRRCKLNYVPTHNFDEGFGWMSRSSELIIEKTPFLIVDDANIKLIYEGAVSFDIFEGQDIRMKVPSIRNWSYPVYSADWFGVLQFQLSGFFRKIENWKLYAFSRNEVLIGDETLYTEGGLNVKLGKLKRHGCER